MQDLSLMIQQWADSIQSMLDVVVMGLFSRVVGLQQFVEVEPLNISQCWGQAALPLAWPDTRF
ncbi:hypothetical protein CBY09_21325 [Acidovorax kalamii]|uniref:Uncharacterized protein n=1 Tax=Acidovorax kalamii TaxID=2004485 RepID=A0A235EGI1_9BURK|nr:hypothetical protein CBY09_21325 [Acidovorax kalamii]